LARTEKEVVEEYYRKKKTEAHREAENSSTHSELVLGTRNIYKYITMNLKEWESSST